MSIKNKNKFSHIELKYFIVNNFSYLNNNSINNFKEKIKNNKELNESLNISYEKFVHILNNKETNNNFYNSNINNYEISKLKTLIDQYSLDEFKNFNVNKETINKANNLNEFSNDFKKYINEIKSSNDFDFNDTNKLLEDIEKINEILNLTLKNIIKGKQNE